MYKGEDNLSLIKTVNAQEISLEDLNDSSENITHNQSPFGEYLNKKTEPEVRILNDAASVDVIDQSDTRGKTSYPEPFLTNEQMKNGGFILYIFGKYDSAEKQFERKRHLYWYDNCLSLAIMYSFLGISLATQDYINPSIDIIKKKGVVSIS